MTKILIIEDEKAIRMSLEDDLKAEGYHVDFATNGQEGLAKAQLAGNDLILLDLMLPGMDGLDVCKEIRRLGITTPVIMLTARSQDIDKILGLELGADDYMVKPFHSHELRARIKAALRRSQVYGGLSGQVIERGIFRIDIPRFQLFKSGRVIELTNLEFGIMQLLMRHPGEVVSRERMLDEVWGREILVDLRTVDAHIAKLRRKIGDDVFHRYIKSVRGIGYKFVEGGAS